MNMDTAVGKVYIFPTEPQRFTDSKSAQQRNGQRDGILAVSVAIKHRPKLGSGECFAAGGAVDIYFCVS